MGKNISKKDILLLVIGKSNRGLTPVKLQKALFIIKQNFDDDLSDFYNFVPYNYGPYDAQIYGDVDDLVKQGLVIKAPINGYSWCNYFISADGISYMNKIELDIDKKYINFINQLADWIGKISFRHLLKTVYEKYPEYSVNSIFREKK